MSWQVCMQKTLHRSLMRECCKIDEGCVDTTRCCSIPWNMHVRCHIHKDPLCQDLKAHQEEIERGEMKQQKYRKPSTWHEEVYHAAPRCQAASLSLTSRRLHGLKKACQVEGQKTGCCLASQGRARTIWVVDQQLCGVFCVQTLCRFKGAGLIRLLLVPNSKDDPDPQVGQGSHRFG